MVLAGETRDIAGEEMLFGQCTKLLRHGVGEMLCEMLINLGIYLCACENTGLLTLAVKRIEKQRPETFWALACTDIG